MDTLESRLAAIDLEIAAAKADHSSAMAAAEAAMSRINALEAKRASATGALSPDRIKQIQVLEERLAVSKNAWQAADFNARQHFLRVLMCEKSCSASSTKAALARLACGSQILDEQLTAQQNTLAREKAAHERLLEYARTCKIEFETLKKQIDALKHIPKPLALALAPAVPCTADKEAECLELSATN